MDLIGLENLSDFENLKKGNILVCEFFRDTYKGNKRTRFATYEIVENKERTNEIILQTKNNVYFNYLMYLNGREGNLKDVAIITKD